MSTDFDAIVVGAGSVGLAALLAAVDRTVTAPGARLLERRISAPSRDLGIIHSRLESVRFLLEQSRFRADLRDDLRRVPDMDRALSRLALDRGGPRDLTAIRAGLTQAGAIAAKLNDVPPLLAEAARALTGHDALADLLDQALVAEPPLLARDGGFIAPDYDPELDEVRRLRDEGRGVIAAMQADFIAETGIQSLKIKHNNVLGYFIETTATHAERMLSPPLSERFIHRQTTANQVRFTTVDLRLDALREVGITPAVAANAHATAKLSQAVLHASAEQYPEHNNCSESCWRFRRKPERQTAKRPASVRYRGRALLSRTQNYCTCVTPANLLIRKPMNCSTVIFWPLKVTSLLA